MCDSSSIVGIVETVLRYLLKLFRNVVQLGVEIRLLLLLRLHPKVARLLLLLQHLHLCCTGEVLLSLLLL